MLQRWLPLSAEWVEKRLFFGNVNKHVVSKVDGNTASGRDEVVW